MKVLDREVGVFLPVETTHAVEFALEPQGCREGVVGLWRYVKTLPRE